MPKAAVGVKLGYRINPHSGYPKKAIFNLLVIRITLLEVSGYPKNLTKTYGIVKNQTKIFEFKITVLKFTGLSKYLRKMFMFTTE